MYKFIKKSGDILFNSWGWDTSLKKLMYYQYGQHCIFGAKFYPEIYKRGILFIGSPGT